jgi:hypothetical protein
MKISTQGGSGFRIQPLPRRGRQVWMILHVVCSVGWLGVLVSNLVLCVTALGADDVTTMSALYTAAGVLADTFFLPGTLLVLLTGVVLGVGTKWGLVKFYWVLVKLVIALVLLVAANLVLAARLARIAAADHVEFGDGMSLVGAFSVLTLTAGLATILSILKPWGRVNWRPARVPAPQETS